MKAVLFLFVVMALLFQVRAESDPPKGERGWKKLLSPQRFEQGMTRAAVEKRITSKVLIEFNSDHGFALLRDVYYELDSAWYAYAFYRSPKGANVTPNADRSTMRLVAGPRLVRNTPELQAHIEYLKGLRLR